MDSDYRIGLHKLMGYDFEGHRIGLELTAKTFLPSMTRYFLLSKVELPRLPPENTNILGELLDPGS